MDKRTRRGLGWLRKLVAAAPVALVAFAAYAMEMMARGNSWG